MSTSIADKSQIASDNFNLGNAYLNSGDYGRAIEYYKISLKISTAIDDNTGITRSYGSLGSAYNKLGDYRQAIFCSKFGLARSTAFGDRSGIASNNSNLGDAYLSLGDYGSAIEYYKKSLEMSTAIADKSGIACNNSNLGDVYFSLGDYGKAIEYYNISLTMSTAIDDKSGMARNNGNLGNGYRCLGDYKKAIDYYKIGLEMCSAIDDKSGIASNNGNLGNAYLSLGDYGKAIDYYKIGLKISTAIGDKSGIASKNFGLCRAYSSLGDYKKAIDYHKVGLQESTGIGNMSEITKSYSSLGSAYHSLGDYAKAIDNSRIGLEMSTAIGDKSGVANFNGNLGDAYQCLGEYESAVLYLMRSISISDEIFLDSVPDQNKLLFTIDYFKRHKILMSCFISLKRIESALLAVDLGRAKELHCSIERRQKTFDPGKFSYAHEIWNIIANKEEQKEIKRIQNTLVKSNEASVLVFAFDVNNFLNVWVLNRKVIFRESISYARLEIIERMIIRFLGSVNVDVNRDSSFCRLKLHSAANLNSPVSFPSEMPSKNAGPKKGFENTPVEGNFTNETILKELFQLLIEPLKDVLKGNKLIIVPDKQLCFTPFSSLIDENGCYLSRSYSIQITPSLHTLKFSMEQSHDADFGFALFVGNPTSNLPNATEEVKCLSKLFKARPLVGREAKRQDVLRLLSGASIIHIAAHGKSERGEIMLAPDVSSTQPFSSPPNPQFSLLTQQDITSISLQAHLVVLCCCDTGQGEVSSEGVIGIARAFLAAGARSVLATLWPISDYATKEFMEVFYDKLCQETSVCEALRRTKNLFQEYKKNAYRFFTIWAPFTIYGEDVVFKKPDIEMIKKRSREVLPDFGFALFVGSPTSNLPGAIVEVESLSKVFEARPLVEREARKEVVLGLLGEASIIHIAAKCEPTRGEIMLAPDVSNAQLSSSAPNLESYLLTQQDIAGISLQARLVVLICCHTEQEEISSEGVAGLARAFLAAGASSVLASLWPIDDYAPEVNMKALYGELCKGSSVSKALESAKGRVKEHEEEGYRSMEFWNQFTIHGEDVMFEQHEVEWIRKKSREMFTDFVVLPQS